jgi:hypothetical protein
MRLQFAGLILLLILIGPLASGQWETDQFLFGSEPNETRPKAMGPVPTPLVRQQTTKGEVGKSSESTEAAATNTTGSIPTVTPVPEVWPTPSELTNPATPATPAVYSIGVEVGHRDYRSTGGIPALQQSQGGTLLGLFLRSQSSQMGELSLHYSAIPEIPAAERPAVSSLKSLHWDEVELDYMFFRETLPNEIQIGTSLGETSWWGHSGVNISNLLKLKYLGAVAQLRLDQDSENPTFLMVRASPWFQSNTGDLQGLGQAVTLRRVLQAKKNSQNGFQLTYEQLSLHDRNEAGLLLSQRSLSFSFYFQLSSP